MLKKIVERYMYVGSYVPENDVSNPADSPAGNAVQSTIVGELLKCTGAQVIEVLFLPSRAWPYGKAHTKYKINDSKIYPGYLNFYVIRHLIFDIKTFKLIVYNKPKVLIKYNPSLLLTILILIYNFFETKKIFYTIIIQDIVGNNSLSSFRGVFNKINLFAAKFADLLVPVTHKILDDFRLPASKAFIFSGGITNQSIKYKNNNYNLADRAVFAGSLELYNGVDILIDQWEKQDICIPLHIFGKGSLGKYINEKYRNSKWIIFHGYQNENIVAEFSSNSKYNIVLRFSRGINQDYFFPSKIFNLICTNGFIIANKFQNIPKSLNTRLTFVNDDLLNLKAIILSSELSLCNPRFDIPKEVTWNYCINKIISRIS